MGRLRGSSIALAMLVGAGSLQAADDMAPSVQIRNFLEQNCFSCHSGETPEANLNLETLATNLEDAELRRRWVFLHDRVSKSEMPPKTADQPDEASQSTFLTTLSGELMRADLAGREVVLRRLNRNEYENTVRDLFGIYVDLKTVLPSDSAEQGFDTIGSRLSLSTEQMMAYIEAADLVLDEVFGPPQAPRRIDKTLNMKDLRSNTTADRILEDGVLLFSAAKSVPTYGASVSVPGLYRVKIQAKAVQTEQPVIMRVDGGVTGRVPSHVAGFFEVPPDEMITIELTDRAVENSDTFAFALVGGFPWWSVGDVYAGAGLFLGEVTVEGPLEEWPRESRKQLLGDVDPKTGTIEDIRSILTRILPRAFRRLTDETEFTSALTLAQQALDEGLPFEKALRWSLKGVLCAPEFLFLEESASPQGRLIDDFALASRLSYFLWSSLPDRELFDLATDGELHEPEVLHAQVERMLLDPKSQRFVENFSDQWLRLRDFDFTVPNDQLYPEYDQLLRQSMLDETHAFFREILDHDMRVRNFIDSDFAMLNGPLADFYGIDGVKGLKMQRVQLPADSLRGGVLTQASVLKVSADGTRTSPVLRGAWILKNLFATPSPPPPPTIAAIEPDIRGATTIREQLAKHRDDPSCARCHRKIDPPGFALESFDVIGGERTWYRTAQAGKYLQIPLHPQSPKHHVRYRQGPDVDASGTLPDGREFSGIRDYKRLLLEDESVLAEPVTRLLMTYSLGRNLGFSDRPEVERIVNSAKEQDYGLRSIIHEIVASAAFRQP